MVLQRDNVSGKSLRSITVFERVLLWPDANLTQRNELDFCGSGSDSRAWSPEKSAEGEAMSQLSDIRSRNISGVNEKETAARVSAFTKSAAVGGGRSRRWSAAGTTSSILERRYPTDGGALPDAVTPWCRKKYAAIKDSYLSEDAYPSGQCVVLRYEDFLYRFWDITRKYESKSSKKRKIRKRRKQTCTCV